MFKTVFTTLLCVLCGGLFAQTSLCGKVTDAESGDPIIYGNVALYQQGVLITGTETDFDGNYCIQNIKAGVYEVEATTVGYAPKRIAKVVIGNNETENIEMHLGQGSITPSYIVCVPLITPKSLSNANTKPLDFTVEGMIHWGIDIPVLDKPLYDPFDLTSGAIFTSEEIRNRGRTY